MNPPLQFFSKTITKCIVDEEQVPPTVRPLHLPAKGSRGHWGTALRFVVEVIFDGFVGFCNLALSAVLECGEVTQKSCSSHPKLMWPRFPEIQVPRWYVLLPSLLRAALRAYTLRCLLQRTEQGEIFIAWHHLLKGQKILLLCFQITI